MKKVILSAFVAIFCATGFAQDVTKEVVNVEGFTYNNDFTASEVATVRRNVVSSLQNTKRIIVVDLTQQASVANEAKKRQNATRMNDNHEVKDIVELNANFILKGALNSINTVSKTGKDLISGNSYTYWESKLSYTIVLIDPATGATASTNTYTSTATSRDGSQAARNSAIEGSASNMKKFIEDCFPVKGTIVAIADGDSKKAKTVYINLGNDAGMTKGQKLAVYQVIDIAGEKSEKEIGTLTVQESMSATRSLCKVDKGGDIIVKAMATNAELTIKTRAKRGFFADVF